MSNNLANHFSKLSLRRKISNNNLGISSSSQPKPANNNPNNLNNLSNLFAGINIEDDVDKIKKILNVYKVIYDESELNLGANASSIQFKISTNAKTSTELKAIEYAVKQLEFYGFKVKYLRNGYIVYPNNPKDTYKPKRKQIRRIRTSKKIHTYYRNTKTQSSQKNMNVKGPSSSASLNNDIYRSAYRSSIQSNRKSHTPFVMNSRYGTMFSHIPTLNRRQFVTSLSKKRRNQRITQKRMEDKKNIRNNKPKPKPKRKTKKKRVVRDYNSNYVPSN